MTSRVSRRSVCWLVAPARRALLALLLSRAAAKSARVASMGPQPVFRSNDGFPLATFATIVRSTSNLMYVKVPKVH